jgi:hypothetical protein
MSSCFTCDNRLSVRVERVGIASLWRTAVAKVSLGERKAGLPPELLPSTRPGTGFSPSRRVACEGLRRGAHKTSPGRRCLASISGPGAPRKRALRRREIQSEKHTSKAFARLSRERLLSPWVISARLCLRQKRQRFRGVPLGELRRNLLFSSSFERCSTEHSQ